MLDNVKAAKEKMSDAMLPLRDKMNNTAQKIYDFVARNVGGGNSYAMEYAAIGRRRNM